MTRPCREGCNRPAAPGRRQCHTCRSRQHLARHPRPRAWGEADETDVALIVESPRPVEGLTRLERVLIARGLSAKDVPAAEIARIVGASKRTVHRWRTTPPAAAKAAA